MGRQSVANVLACDTGDQCLKVLRCAPPGISRRLWSDLIQWPRTARRETRAKSAISLPAFFTPSQCFESQPTTQPTKCDCLHDFRVFRQSPRTCKLLKNLIRLD
jgi:hypothetical protein